MKLSELIKDYQKMISVQADSSAADDPDILFLTADSRQVKPGCLFFAVKGQTVDGHDYITQALERGAAAVIAQSGIDFGPDLNDSGADKTIIRVENSRQCMAHAAARFYGHPSKEMILVGITGTNGKTTITWLLESMLKAAGFHCGVIGTVNVRYPDHCTDNPMTTPDAIELQKILAQMKSANVTHVIVEVSSHGLDLNRVDGCHFDVGIFTNLTQDHLDYHHDLDTYFECKKQLFTRFLGSTTPKNGLAVLNIDDPKGKELFHTLSCRKISVSAGGRADIYSTGIRHQITGISGTLCLPGTGFPFQSALTGRFNLENILCAAGAAHALGLSEEKIKAGLTACTTIPGRLEKIKNTIERHLFVDYAHTPDALESILKTLKANAQGRLITVFGCGGDRDRTKRPLMGKIATGLSDIAIVTSDNPRTENPDAIIRDILAGMEGFEQLSAPDLESHPFTSGYLVEPDRKKALETAVFLSKPDDIILAAGKGHETYQITNSGTNHFDDREVLEEAANRLSQKLAPMVWASRDLVLALETDPVLCPLSGSHLFSTIGTDSRTIETDQLFLALKGENFDGHTFIASLIDKGIKGFIVEKGYLQDQNIFKKAGTKDLLVFEVPDTLIALGQLARYQRLRSKVQLVAVTGSSGKTTTRRMIRQIFKTRFHTLSTRKNFNNEIGVPLTLLNLSAAHEWAVVEMGMNHAGEISRLSQMAEPNMAVITNTAAVHLEGLGTIENVARAKAEIFEGLQPGSTAILFARDEKRDIIEPLARENTNIHNIRFFGDSPDADVKAKDIETTQGSIHFTAHFEDQACPVQINSPARFMVDNCLAAVTAARAAGIDPVSIQQGIKRFSPEPGRMNIRTLSRDIRIIDDTYNANPASVKEALKTLASVSLGHKTIAVLADMLELGDQSELLHYQTGQLAARLNINELYLFGTQVAHTLKGALDSGFDKEKIFHFTKEKIIDAVINNVGPGTWILVKGSRGMAMETVVTGLKDNLIDRTIKG